MSLYKEIEEWYSKNGISTEQFRQGSTEEYLDEMTHDFMRRSIQSQSQLKEANEVIDHYAHIGNWNGGEHANRTHPNDMEMITDAFGIKVGKFGGKLARDYQKKWDMKPG